MYLFFKLFASASTYFFEVEVLFAVKLPHEKKLIMS